MSIKLPPDLLDAILTQNSERVKSLFKHWSFPETERAKKEKADILGSKEFLKDLKDMFDVELIKEFEHGRQ